MANSTLTGAGVADVATAEDDDKIYAVRGGASIRPSVRQIAARVLGGGIPDTVGDGDADDRVALQAALDAVPSWGGEVRITKPHFISGALTVSRSGTRIVGAGGKLIAPDAGWPLNTTADYGMLTIQNKERTSVEGLQFYGTKLANIGNTPKFIYIGDSTNVSIHDNIFENTKYEGIWEGGTIALVRYISVCRNLFKNVGYPATPYGQLPAIQMNAYDAIIDRNILIDVGVGIGASGAGTIVSNNKVTGALTGIATGDGPQANAITFIGNNIELTASPSTVVIGIYLGGGTGTPGSGLQTVKGNTIRLIGHADNLAPLGIFSGTSEHISLGANDIEIIAKGTATNIEGSTNGSYAFLSHNVVHVMGQTSQCLGFTGRPNGAGKSLTVVSRANTVYGMDNSNGSFGFDYGDTPGTLTAFHENDLILGGSSFRSGATYNAVQAATMINLP